MNAAYCVDARKRVLTVVAIAILLNRAHVVKSGARQCAPTVFIRMHSPSSILVSDF